MANIKATFLFKVSDTLLDQTDSVIISALIGTVFVGYYYNYYIIVTYLVSIAGIMASGLVASFGNLVAEGDRAKSYEMFKVSMLLFSVYGAITVSCYCSVIQDFIPLWIGKEYIMGYDFVVALMIVYYLRMSTNTLWIYRSAMGIFREVQYCNVIAAILNIGLSICLGKAIGMSGVIVATAISRLLSSVWYEGRVVFRKFNKPVSEYYWRQVHDFAICCVCLLTSLSLSSLVLADGIVGLIRKTAVALITSILIEWAVWHKSKEYRVVLNAVFKRVTPR